ncbi:MAG: DNA gyrase subunit A [Planctomycetes bacterium]|nr:DNA gyrase subunit A [Planctomycetota bacterium]
MTEPNAPDAPRIVDRAIEHEVRVSYLNYSMSVIQARALPDVRDGLKPSQRRILVAMHDLRLGPNSKRLKSAKICGNTSGDYHPHGESIVYPTLVRMAQDFSLRYPLVDPQGNFGSIDGDPPAAMRYTEARLSAVGAEILIDIDSETVDFRDNYDARLKEPVVLPSRMPNLICNGSEGIAVGMTTSMPPHNLTEVVEGIIYLLENPNCTVDDLMLKITAPDFPTGGIICGRQGIADGYRTGHGLLTVRAHYVIEDDRNRTAVVFTDIPYQKKKEDIIEKMAEVAKDGRVRGVHDLRDESNKDGLRIYVELKKGEDPELIANQFYEHTPLQDTFSIHNIAIVNGRPITLNLKQMLEHYRDHRVDVIRRRTRYLLKKAEARHHILLGLQIAIDHLDEVIAIIRGAASVEQAREALRTRFALTQVQADAILEMRLARLTGLERDKLIKELAEVTAEVNNYKDILTNSGRVTQLIREDLLDLKNKYGDERRTEIAGPVKAMDEKDLIAHELVAVTVTRDGYLKRCPVSTYRRQRRGGRGVTGAETKEGDVLSYLFVADTHDYILVFTDDGRVHWLEVYELPNLARNAKGRSVANLLQLKNNEKIAAMLPVKAFDETLAVFFATELGTIKKTSLEQFSRPKRGGIRAINLDEGDRLIGVSLVSPGDQIILATSNGYAIRFDESDSRSMGRSTTGVRGISLRDKDKVVDLVVGREGMQVLAACENGFGKRTAVEEYRLQTRGGMGVINIKVNERNGKVVNVLIVDNVTDLLLLTKQGMVQRIHAAEIRETGRAAQGVKLMDLENEDTLTTVARVPQIDEAAEAKEASGAVPEGPVDTDPAPGGAGESDPAGDDPNV